MKHEKRVILVTTYVVLLFFAYFLLCLGDMPPYDSYMNYSHIDYITLIAFAIVYLAHHVVCFLFLKSNGGIFPFQFLCSIADLMFLIWMTTLPYVFFKEWAVALIIGSRLASLLSFVMLFEKNRKNR